MSCRILRQAARSLAELSTPHYHHEFVKRALMMAFEAPASGPALLSLLAHLASSSQVTLVRAFRFCSPTCLVLCGHACWTLKPNVTCTDGPPTMHCRATP